MRIVYLHGFASSPQSSKAQFFQRKFAELGIPFEAPELDQGNFEALTISGMLTEVGNVIGNGTAAGQSAILMGSSLGGFVAAMYATRHPQQVEKLVLLAPALQFYRRWRLRFSAEQLADWESRGWAPFYHYGRKKDARLGYSFVEDAAKYDWEPDFRQPALILHGTEDSVVSIESSRAFVASHGAAKLCEFQSGHELTDVVDAMWEETRVFLNLI